MNQASEGGGGGGGGWEGMNPDVVEPQARQLQDLGHQTKSLITKIDGEIARLGENWHGDDAKKFVADWQGQHKTSLSQSAEMLDQMGQTALHNASQQRSTSGH